MGAGNSVMTCQFVCSSTFYKKQTAAATPARTCCLQYCEVLADDVAVATELLVQAMVC
jgi:hypothetical protein